MEYSLGHPHGHGDVTEPDKPKTAQGIIAKSQRDCETAKAKSRIAAGRPIYTAADAALEAGERHRADMKKLEAFAIDSVERAAGINGADLGKEPYSPQKPSVAGITQTLSEVHRTYVWANGDEYKLGEPRVLYAQRDEEDGVIHVIKDSAGMYHYIPAGWLVFKSLPRLS